MGWFWPGLRQADAFTSDEQARRDGPGSGFHFTAEARSWFGDVELSLSDFILDLLSY